MSVIVYGPRGCGKSQDSQRIADALGLHCIVDGWEPRLKGFSANGHLYITNYIRPEDAWAIREQHPETIIASYSDATITKLLGEKP